MRQINAKTSTVASSSSSPSSLSFSKDQVVPTIGKVIILITLAHVVRDSLVTQQYVRTSYSSSSWSSLSSALSSTISPFNSSFSLVRNTTVNNPSSDTSSHDRTNSQQQQQQPQEQPQPVLPPIPVHVYHKAVAGLGHRLSRQASAWHFAKAIQAPTIQLDWGWCVDPKRPKKNKKNNNKNNSLTNPNNNNNNDEEDDHIVIFEYMFGNMVIDVPRAGVGNSSNVSLPFVKELKWDFDRLAAAAAAAANDTNASTNQTSTSILSTTGKGGTQPPSETFDVALFSFLNDIPDYTSTKVSIIDLQKTTPLFYGKDQTDEELFSLLRSRFRFMDRVRTFQDQHQFSKHTVLGLHLRFGNGEKGDFLVKERNLTIGQEEFVHNLGILIVQFWTDYLESSPIANGKPPLIFVATDSADPQGLVDDLKAAIDDASATNRTGNRTGSSTIPSIPVVATSRNVIPKGAGVAFNYKHESKEKCIESWVAQFVDMVLLTESDVVMAGLYSSFTQAMPLSYHLGKKDRETPGLICNVGKTATVMECFDDYMEWFKQPSQDLGVVAESLTEGNTLIIGDKKGMTQKFHTAARPQMPFHAYRLPMTIMKTLADYPVEMVKT